MIKVVGAQSHVIFESYLKSLEIVPNDLLTRSPGNVWHVVNFQFSRDFIWEYPKIVSISQMFIYDWYDAGLDILIIYNRTHRPVGLDLSEISFLCEIGKCIPYGFIKLPLKTFQPLMIERSLLNMLAYWWFIVMEILLISLLAWEYGLICLFVVIRFVV